MIKANHLNPVLAALATAATVNAIKYTIPVESAASLFAPQADAGQTRVSTPAQDTTPGVNVPLLDYINRTDNQVGRGASKNMAFHDTD